MGDKYTLKDFLSYFLTGLFLVVIVVMLYHPQIIAYCHAAGFDLGANSALLIFLLIPCCYLLGQFVHGIDMIVFDILMVVSDFSRRDAVRKNKLLAPLKFVSFLLNGHRITERLKDLPMDSALFWKECSRLVANGKYDKSDYWGVLHLLAEGLVLVSFFWLLWFTVYF
ncbi:MAG: hypothetical protein HC859_11325 [Bacteroidia bacterium]|nr:hypothetical protein [Bacteroidia bacterium]